MKIADQSWTIQFHLGSWVVCGIDFTYDLTNTFNSSVGAMDMAEISRSVLELQLHSREGSSK